MENIGSIEWMSLPENEQQLQELQLNNESHPAMRLADNAIKMKRSPNQVFILLFGLSGAGKKSTIDYLFGTNVRETSESRPGERSTIEYTVQLKSIELRIRDLQLSIIDTPSFGDIDGIEQDAKNIMSIKYFLESNLYNLKRYPNLVMIMLNINDHRLVGLNSDFSKMLKGISKVNAIDVCNNTVVVVLTHAMGIAGKPQIWKERVEMKKAEVQKIVQDYLGITPEIVVQENEPEDNDLQKDGEGHLLPNYDKQPQILYEACERILNISNDEIAHEAVAVCFRSGIDKRVRKGQITSSSSTEMVDTQAMRMFLLNLEETFLTSEVGSKLENYKKRTTEKELVNDIFILQVRFGDLGIFKICDLQSMSINTLVEKMHPTRITKHMQRVLDEVFRLSTVDTPQYQDNFTSNAPPNASFFRDDSFKNLRHQGRTFDSIGCFPEDSLVMLNNQKKKLMKDLSVGDKILTAACDYGTLIQDEVITWLHHLRDEQFVFLQIVHDNGKITLTPEHIMFVGKDRYPKHASNLKPGDHLYFITNDNARQTATMSTVLSIRKINGRGIYAPLTYSGRLLVDNVDVSCYCTLNPLKAVGREIISSHTLAHAGFLPLRIAFNIGMNISYDQSDDETGIHGYARWLMKRILGK